MGNHYSQVVEVFQTVEGVATTVLEAVSFLSKIVAVEMVKVEHNKSNGGGLVKVGSADDAKKNGAALVRLGDSAEDAKKNVTELQHLLRVYLQNSWMNNFGYANDTRDNVTPSPPYAKSGVNINYANDVACDTEANIKQNYKNIWYKNLARFNLDTTQFDSMFTEVWGQVRTQSDQLQYAITARSFPISSTDIHHKDTTYYIDIAGTGATIKQKGDVPLFLLGFELVLYEAYDPMFLKKLHKK